MVIFLVLVVNFSECSEFSEFSEFSEISECSECSEGSCGQKLLLRQCAAFAPACSLWGFSCAREMKMVESIVNT